METIPLSPVAMQHTANIQIVCNIRVSAPEFKVLRSNIHQYALNHLSNELTMENR